MKKVFVFAGVVSVASDVVKTLLAGKYFTILISQGCPGSSIEEKIDTQLKKASKSGLISEVRSSIDFGKTKSLGSALKKEIAATATDEVVVILPSSQYLGAIKALEGVFKTPPTSISSHYYWEVSEEILATSVPV